MSPFEIKVILLIIVVLVSQGTWIFTDANKRGENKWLWGMFGLINFPSSLIIYLLITRRFTRQIICPNCLYSISKDSHYCAYCGHELTEQEKLEGKSEKKRLEYKNK